MFPILDCLTGHNEARSVNRIADLMGKTPAAAQNHLNKAMNRGLVDRRQVRGMVGAGRTCWGYYLTDPLGIAAKGGLAKLRLKTRTVDRHMVIV